MLLLRHIAKLNGVVRMFIVFAKRIAQHVRRACAKYSGGIYILLELYKSPGVKSIGNVELTRTDINQKAGNKNGAWKCSSFNILFKGIWTGKFICNQSILRMSY